MASWTQGVGGGGSSMEQNVSERARSEGVHNL